MNAWDILSDSLAADGVTKVSPEEQHMKFEYFFVALLDLVGLPPADLRKVAEMKGGVLVRTKGPRHKGGGRLAIRGKEKGSGKRPIAAFATQDLLSHGVLSWRERALLLQFFTHCCNSYEHPIIRKSVLGVISTPLWLSLPAPELKAIEAGSGGKALKKHMKGVKGNILF